jgi:hypothetical protein
VTFKGLRIRDINDYFDEATEKWHLPPSEVMPYTFDELNRLIISGVRLTKEQIAKMREKDLQEVEEPPHHLMMKT